MDAKSLALVKAGWWQTTWWPSQWWHEDWWLEYGTAVTGGDSSRYYYLQPLKPKQERKTLLLVVKELLYTLKGE